MIITKLIGGMGNQLFQYAVGRRLAHHHGVLLKIDITAFREYKLRTYHLNPLNIIESVATDEEIDDLKNRHWIRERHFHFDPEILQLGSDVYLDGYWQSEKYFKDIEGIIRNEFIVREPVNGENERHLNQIQSCNAVAIHIRRGDYVTNPSANQYHGVCSLEYYYQAVALIAERVGNPHFFIFSDEWDWVRENFHINYPVTIINNNANWPEQDLRLMSACRHHIIANSSFSWWGAWLGTHPDRIVIAPQKWFNTPEHCTQDLLPEYWLKI